MSKLERLTALAEKYGTDKLGHGYIPHYAKHLPDTCRTMLEVGCEHGRSALVWNDFYGQEELELSLLDLFINTEFKSQRWCWNRNFRTYKGDQSDINFLYSIREQFDVIVEDGSHRSDHQQQTFMHLFFNNLKRGGLYVVEDLKCCLDRHYWSDTVTKFEDTFLWALKNYKETGELSNLFFNEHQSQIFKPLILSVDLYEDEGIAFIVKS